MGLRRMASRLWFGVGLAVLWLTLSTPAALAGQGGGQAQPAADNIFLWIVGGLVILMLAAGVGLLYTRRKK